MYQVGEVNSSAAQSCIIACHELEAGRVHVELVMYPSKVPSERVSLAPGPCTNGYDVTPTEQSAAVF